MYIILLLTIKISMINLGEANMVGAKLDWCEKTKQLGSLGRLRNLLWNLQRNQELFKSQDQVIQEQLAEGVVEKVNGEGNWSQGEFYLLHKRVIQENVESINQRIVYDSSTRDNSRSLSSNNCL